MKQIIVLIAMIILGIAIAGFVGQFKGTAEKVRWERFGEVKYGDKIPIHRGGKSVKQFIILCAVLPLLLVMIMQFGTAQSGFKKEATIREAVYDAVQVAKNDGCFQHETIKMLRKEIARKAQIEEKRIVIEAEKYQNIAKTNIR